MPKILAVVGQEPRREGEYPSQLHVGWAFNHTDNMVSRIEEEQENLGTYGITWFVAYHADGRMIAKMNALNIAEVHYMKEE